MAKQPLKKKDTAKSFSSFKEKMGLKATKELSNADRPIEWLTMPKAFQDALKIVGIPKGFVTLVVGHSNSGKSTLINHAIVAAQKQNLIPVIYDTENNFDFTYAIDMGMEADPIYEDVDEEVVNTETGEVEIKKVNKITSYDGNFLYFNNVMLAERYGKNDYSTGKENPKGRKVAVIEDIAASINELLNAQDEGEIENGFVFIWDSVGSISSWKSYKSATNNAMWDAAAISVAFNTIVNDRIPRSRKVSSPYSNTFIAVNKVWLDSMSNPMPGAPPSLSLKGGNSLFYSARLIILTGGQLKASTKRLTAVSKGATYNYGLQTKIKVLKNQLPNPWTVTYEGDVVCTPHGLISTDKDALEEYRKTHLKDILKNLEMMSKTENVQESDVVFSEEDETEMV
jgi:energy-coupling factor transporter ATP-binding protein EcfA2